MFPVEQQLGHLQLPHVAAVNEFLGVFVAQVLQLGLRGGALRMNTIHLSISMLRRVNSVYEHQSQDYDLGRKNKSKRIFFVCCLNRET